MFSFPLEAFENEWSNDMSAPRISSPTMANSRKSPAAQVVEGHATNLLQYQGERPIASRESAHLALGLRMNSGHLSLEIP
jgi:hypothetical protein